MKRLLYKIRMWLLGLLHGARRMCRENRRCIHGLYPRTAQADFYACRNDSAVQKRNP